MIAVKLLITGFLIFLPCFLFWLTFNPDEEQLNNWKMNPNHPILWILVAWLCATTLSILTMLVSMLWIVWVKINV